MARPLMADRLFGGSRRRPCRNLAERLGAGHRSIANCAQMPCGHGARDQISPRFVDVREDAFSSDDRCAELSCVRRRRRERPRATDVWNATAAAEATERRRRRTTATHRVGARERGGGVAGAAVWPAFVRRRNEGSRHPPKRAYTRAHTSQGQRGSEKKNRGENKDARHRRTHGGNYTTRRAHGPSLPDPLAWACGAHDPWKGNVALLPLWCRRTTKMANGRGFVLGWNV